MPYAHSTETKTVENLPNGVSFGASYVIMTCAGIVKTTRRRYPLPESRADRACGITGAARLQARLGRGLWLPTHGPNPHIRIPGLGVGRGCRRRPSRKRTTRPNLIGGVASTERLTRGRTSVLRPRHRCVARSNRVGRVTFDTARCVEHRLC